MLLPLSFSISKFIFLDLQNNICGKLGLKKDSYKEYIFRLCYASFVDFLSESEGLGNVRELILTTNVEFSVYVQTGDVII